MNLFQNSNSNTWRGQEYRNDPQPDSTVSKGITDTADSLHQDHAQQQDSPRQSEPRMNNPQQQEHPENRNFSSGQSWMDNPALAGIDPSRLQMLSSLASQAQGKKQNELLPFLMAAASQSNANGLSFGPDEIDTIISVMKAGKSPREIQQIDRICTLMRQFNAMRGLNHRR